MSKKMVPEVRFKGFSDDWERRKLSDTVSITMGQSPKSSNYTNNPNDHILVQGNTDIVDGWVKPRIWTKQVTKVAKRGSTLLSVRAPVGDVSNTKYDIVIGRGIAALSENSFIFQLLQSINSTGYWKRLITGSTFESINSDDIKNLNIQIPFDVNEQKKVSDLLSLADKLITLQQEQLDLYKKLKKGLLQKLFPKDGEKIPEVRFANFTGNWEQHSFQNTLIIHSGKDYKHLNKGTIPVYGTGGYMLSVDEELSKVDSIGLGRKGTIDKPQYLKAPFWTVDTLFYMTPKDNFEILFLYAIIQKFDWKKLNEASGVPSLSKKTIEKVIQFYPTQLEQKKLGFLLKVITETVLLQQYKINELKSLKKYLLQKLFI